MKKGKILIFLIAFLLFVGNVNAFPETYKGQESKTFTGGICSVRMRTSGNTATFECEVSPADEVLYPYFTIKQATIGGKTVRAVCLSGMRYARPAVNQTCTLDKNWTGEESAVIGYIIKTIEAGSGNDFQKTYLEENIIQYYLGVLVVGNDTEKARANNFIRFYTDNNITGINMKLPALINAGKASAANNVGITANGKDSLDLTFKLGEDGYYYSDPVTIASANATRTTLGNISNSKFSYDKSGDKYTFKIKETDIGYGKTESFSMAVTADKEYYVAGKYICDGNPNDGEHLGYQNMTYVETETRKYTKSITINGSVKRDPATIEINKLDENGKKIKGITFELKTKAQKENKEEGTKGITDGENNLVFNNLTETEYYLTEVAVPDGYTLKKDEYKITISSDGKVSINGTKQNSNVVEIVNNLNITKVLKISSETKKALSGAKLEILDSNKKSISCKLSEDGTATKVKSVNKCEWTSTDKEQVVVGLKAGKYYLKEVAAPKGYELNKKEVAFEVKVDKAYAEVKMTNDVIVEVPDTLSTRSIVLIIAAVLAIGAGAGLIAYAIIKRRRAVS